MSQINSINLKKEFSEKGYCIMRNHSSKIIPKTSTSIALVELINSKKGVKGVAIILKNTTPIKKNGK